MIADLRRRFNASFTPDKYQTLLRTITGGCGVPVEFRIAETPCFFPQPLVEKMCRYGKELIDQLTSAKYLVESRHSIPAEFDVPNEPSHPLFVQVDFGLVRDSSGSLEPKLVELQGFPSLYAYQPVLCQAYTDIFGLEGNLRYFLSDLDSESYARLLRQAIVAGCDPENVVLMEIDPLHQKTLPDFLLTEKLLGIKTVDIQEIRQQGRRLWYPLDGKSVPIQRIYNRAIVEDLVRRNASLQFRFSDDLDVEWAGHPNWFFRMSKYSIPFLAHECVPKAHFLSEVGKSTDLGNFVLKPLFSFAGAGINLHPSGADLEQIPDERRSDYILQERMDFAPVIDTPLGMTKAEVRIMYIWDQHPVPVTTIVRMGRGKMMGVDHNKNMEWVGASAGLF